VVKGLMTLKRYHDIYLIKMNIYDEKGRLIESRDYNNIIHVEIEECEKIIHHISLNNSTFVLVVSGKNNIILEKIDGKLLVACK